MAKKESEVLEVLDLTGLETKIDELKDIAAELRKDVAANLDATKELTKTVGEIVAAWEKWRKAGKF